jgi:hypothetical protein
VDHQIVRCAASDVTATAVPGSRVVFYEDYPYAQDPQAVKAVLELASESGAAEWREELVPLTEAALEAKIAAIACYHSQLSTFWTSPTEMATAIRAFAEQTGSDGPAERYWMYSLS